jgi:tungstate transport system ATP-binding protein
MALAAELRGLTKEFDGITALQDVDLQIVDGEIFTVLGANGSGKTTLLKIMALIEKPSRGEILLHGERVTEKNLRLMRLQTTMVFQKTILFTSTVHDNIAYGLRIRKAKKERIRDEVSRVLQIVGLQGFEKRQARKLSGGEQQRVALARALALNSKFLLLDEPTANLDPLNASIIEEVINKVNHEAGTTILMATHNMFQAKGLSTRVALIERGRITEIGAPGEIFGDFSRSLASFGAAENIFRGVSEMAQDGTTSIDIGSGIHVAATFHRVGEVSIFINPKDIIVSRYRFESSARNFLRGQIIEVKDMGAIVKVKVDVGKPFIAEITKRSFSEMKLNVYKEVYLTFKASSVQVL